MPFNELQRRDSWPPTIIRIRDNEPDDLDTDAIDENPFSFFLTSPEDVDDDFDDLSAGIEGDASDKNQIREISPSALQRAPLEDDEDEDFGLAMPLTLKDFTASHTSGRKSRLDKIKEDGLTGLGISLPEFSIARGRAKVRLTPMRGGRGRGQTRSLSARRPHSWREPSPELTSIKEERESDDGEDGKAQGRIESIGTHKLVLSSSAPASAMVRQGASPSPKPKKRVHWAF
jgi:hypothetical protein